MRAAGNWVGRARMQAVWAGACSRLTGGGARLLVAKHEVDPVVQRTGDGGALERGAVDGQEALRVCQEGEDAQSKAPLVELATRPHPRQDRR